MIPCRQLDDKLGGLAYADLRLAVRAADQSVVGRGGVILDRPGDVAPALEVRGKLRRNLVHSVTVRELEPLTHPSMQVDKGCAGQMLVHDLPVKLMHERVRRRAHAVRPDDGLPASNEV